MAASTDSENAQQLKSELSASLNEKNYSKDEGKTATVTPYLVIKKEDNFTLKREETTDLERKVQEGLKQYDLFSQSECEMIERKLEELMADFNRGLYKPSSLDRSKLRNKYFFGERYTYGDGFGQEMLFPVGQIDPIPTWITEMVIAPLEEAGILPVGFTNSAVINLYLPGGCIVSHIDPPHIFDRPIVSASFLSDTVLSFGCKFSFKPIRSTCPVTTVRLRRGSVVSMEGYAANNITHCIRPQDIKYRRAAIILRRVLPDAPRMSMANFYSLAQLHPGFSFLRLRRKRSWEETEQLTTHVRRKRARVDFHGNI